MAEKKKKKMRWLPLESNPEVLNDFISKLGVDTSKWSYCDVYGIDPDLLAMIPRPVIALLLLFPITQATETDDKKQAEEIIQKGQTVSPNLWYIKQTIGNACGTIGVLHSIGNNLEKLDLKKDSHFAKFFSNCQALSPQERAKFLEEYEAFAVAHEESGKQGQTQAPNPEEKVELHFIALVEKDGNLYEMDGRKKFPINHGPTSPDTFLEDAINVTKHFIERDPNQISFNIMALTASQ